MKKYLLLSLLPLMCSCSSLKVKVSTANPDMLKIIADKIDSFEELAFQYKKAFEPLLFTKILTEKDQIILQSKDVLAWSNHSDDLQKERAVFENNYISTVNDILSDYNRSNILMKAKKYEDAIEIYLSLPHKFQKLSYDLTIEKSLQPEQKRSIINELSNRLTIVNAMFYGGRANLLGDKMVAYVTLKKNENIWESTYNETISRTYFGTADIAVVLNEMPNSYNNNYSIKGVRVDAAKLIQSSFDVMTQVLNVMAAMSGIIPANNSDTNYSYPDKFPEIQTLPVKTVELQNRKDLLRESQKQLLLKILGENLDLKSENELKTSVIQIKNYWDIYKQILDP